jgi:hypothetical protein
MLLELSLLLLVLVGLYYYINHSKSGFGSSWGYAPEQGHHHHGGYHRAYVPGIYTGYIPDVDLLPIIPNNLPQCIDGDSLRPCWTINNGAVSINH